MRFICAICGEQESGYGKSALPDAEGLCCEACFEDSDIVAYQIEEDYIHKQVKRKPYRDFDSMSKLVKSEKYKQNLKRFAFEYDLLTHQHCKRMYDSYLDGDVMKSVGEDLHTVGGLDLMRACYWILCLYGHRSVFDLRFGDHWQGIGKWSRGVGVANMGVS